MANELKKYGINATKIEDYTPSTKYDLMPPDESNHSAIDTAKDIAFNIYRDADTYELKVYRPSVKFGYRDAKVVVKTKDSDYVKMIKAGVAYAKQNGLLK